MNRLFVLIIAFASASVVAEDTTAVTGSYFAVIVSDVETASTWYQETLGLEEKTRFTEEGRYDVINLAGSQLFVELLELAAAEERPEHRVEGPFKVGMLVRDIDVFIASLPDSIEPPEIIADERNNLLLIQLRDPDNYIVQVMQLLEE